MDNSKIDFLEVIKSYKPLELKKEIASKVVVKSFKDYFKDYNVNELPKEYLMLLYPFSALIPQKYYSEDIYKRVLNILRETYEKDSSYAFEILKYFDDSFCYGYDHYNFLCELINGTNTEEMSRRTKFEFCYLPWYAKIFEGIYFKIISIILSALLFLKENEKDLNKINSFSNWDKHNKLNKHGFSDLASSCNFIIRNSISHQIFNFEDKMFEMDKIRFEDQNNPPEILSDQGFIDLFKQFLDDCSSIILALLVFKLQHYNEIKFLTVSEV